MTGNNGAMIYKSSRKMVSIGYDLASTVCMTFSNNSRTEYVYTSMGENLRTFHTKSLYTTTVLPLKPMLKVQSAAVNSGTGFSNPTIIPKDVLPMDSTDYLENFFFENGKPDKYLFSGGYYSYSGNQLPSHTGGLEVGITITSPTTSGTAV